ncbi:MAG TPA: tetratricopeptide repeat protein [Terriglobales bacterium]|nr:tetratricopeptide repeat protein [Terriglobales bacterium]
MTDATKPGAAKPRSSSGGGLGRVLLPLALLAVFGAAIYGRHWWVTRSSRATLTQAEAQKLDASSKALMDQGRYQEALAPTLELYQAYPENHIYIGHLAEIYDHLGQYSEEAQYWEKYVDRAPTPVEACPKYGQAYAKAGRDKDAIAAFQRCLSFSPKNSDSYFYLAHAQEMDGQWDEAAKNYETGLAISPDYTDLRLGLARCRLRQDQPAEALKIANQVLAKNPNKADALLILGMVYLHDDKPAEAKTALERGVKVADTDPDFHRLLARAYGDLNDSKGELREYNRLVELLPNDKTIRARRDALQAKQP